MFLCTFIRSLLHTSDCRIAARVIVPQMTDVKTPRLTGHKRRRNSPSGNASASVATDEKKATQCECPASACRSIKRKYENAKKVIAMLQNASANSEGFDSAELRANQGFCDQCHEDTNDCACCKDCDQPLKDCGCSEPAAEFVTATAAAIIPVKDSAAAPETDKSSDGAKDMTPTACAWCKKEFPLHELYTPAEDSKDLACEECGDVKIPQCSIGGERYKDVSLLNTCVFCNKLICKGCAETTSDHYNGKPGLYCGDECTNIPADNTCCSCAKVYCHADQLVECGKAGMICIQCKIE